MASTRLWAKLNKRIASNRPCGGTVAALMLLALVIPSARSQTASPTYSFKQKSAIQGNSELIVSPLGVKMTLTDRHLIIFMRPPLWHVQYCDLRSKRYYECAKEQFREPFAGTISVTKPSSCTGLIVQSSKSSTFMNLPCKEFALVNPVRSEGKRTRSWEEIAIQSGTLTGYSEGTAKIVGRTLCQVYAVPRLDVLPLVVIARSYREESSNELETSSIKKIAATASDFAVPPQCVQVAKANDVVADYNVDSGITDLLK